MRLLLLCILLSGCAAAPSTDPCVRQCTRFHDSCMDAGSGGLITNPQALYNIEAQCNAGYESCLRSCRQSP